MIIFQQHQTNLITTMASLPQTIRWDAGELYLLDQTKLPIEVIEEKQESVEQVWDSIKQLKVRGAPAIGVASIWITCRNSGTKSIE